MPGNAKQQLSEHLHIHEAAELLGVTPTTLRNWDKAGKLTPKRNPINGYRMYRHEDLLTVLQPAQPDAPNDLLAPAVDWAMMGESEHFVQFYEDDTILVNAVNEFIGAALEKGKGGIVIGTREHNDDIQSKLKEKGVDVQAVLASGQLHCLDAADTLSQFMIDGKPDRDRFDEVIGALVAKTIAQYGHIHAFGEMVALLWENNEREAAIRLEELWNELGEIHDFALFCAYPIRAFADVKHDELFSGVCGCHSKVIPTESYASLMTPDQRLRAISRLQQKASALEAEIGHRKEVEKSLLKRERELKDFFENAAEAIHTVGVDGTILWANKAELNLLGYEPAEYIGHSITGFHADGQVIEDILQRLKRGETLKEYEARLRTRHGAIKHVLINSNVHWENGKFLYTRCFTRDITEKRRLQENLIEADRRKDEFLAMLAHELRNPLAPISNALNILQAPQVKEEIKAEAHKLMQRQVHQMKRLIEDLMDISRISEGKIELKKQSVPLSEVIQSAVETAKPLITEKRHELAITQPHEPVSLEGDVVRLSQIFTNLLNNAAKYTDEGGRIALTIRKEASEAVISFKDNGIGISAEKLPAIFNMFVQVDNSIERTQGGLGIGLTLVKELVKLHGGSIAAHSEGIGKGSEFTIRLPVATKKSKDESAHQSLSETGKAYRILVVDDNEASAKTLGWTLELLGGHEIKLAHDAKWVMEIAKDYRPDIILLDIGLPGISGYDVCKWLRQEPETKDAVIIAQTGWGQDEHRKRSQDAGFDHHLVKPVEMHTLQKLLSTLK